MQTRLASTVGVEVCVQCAVPAANQVFVDGKTVNKRMIKATCMSTCYLKATEASERILYNSIHTQNIFALKMVEFSPLDTNVIVLICSKQSSTKKNPQQ